MDLKWPQVIQKVENTSSRFRHRELNQRKMQQRAYRLSLQRQIEQQQKINKQKKTRKQEELKSINLQVNKQKQIQFKKNMGKRGIQKYYQMQNQKVYNTNKNLPIRQNLQSDGKHSQFLQQLFKNADQRKERTIKNFSLQQSINQIQQKTHRQANNILATKAKQEASQYNKYVERQFKKKQMEKQLWKNKYIRNNSQHFSNLPTNDKKNYHSFLDSQIKEKQLNLSKRKNEVIDEKLMKFNLNLQNSNSSPAYLGKVSISSDRQKQLNLLNKHLLDTQKGDNFVYSTTEAQKKRNKVNSSINQYGHSYSNPAKTESQATIKSQLSSRRQYMGYNLISGQKQIYHL